jgi:hypothetical protein
MKLPPAAVPATPIITLPFARSGPPVTTNPISFLACAIARSHNGRPVFVDSATMWASEVAR